MGARIAHLWKTGGSAILWMLSGCAPDRSTQPTTYDETAAPTTRSKHVRHRVGCASRAPTTGSQHAARDVRRNGRPRDRIAARPAAGPGKRGPPRPDRSTQPTTYDDTAAPTTGSQHATHDVRRNGRPRDQIAARHPRRTTKRPPPRPDRSTSATGSGVSLRRRAGWGDAHGVRELQSL